MEQPYTYGSVCAKQFADDNFPYEEVCCPYFPVRRQSQIIDDYGIISCCLTQLLKSAPPFTPGKLKKNLILGIHLEQTFLGPAVNEGILCN